MSKKKKNSISLFWWRKQASEIAIGDTGYIAPEHGQPGVDNSKSDTYTFGVLLLELLTGRKPFDKYDFGLLYYCNYMFVTTSFCFASLLWFWFVISTQFKSKGRAVSGEMGFIPAS